MDGLLIVNKEKGYTSRDIVNIACKKLGTKKIGHTGTLDPIATGVLVLCIGKATKMVELITNSEKEYIAHMIFGISTDTIDVTGNILKEEIFECSEEKIKEAVLSMKGIYEQEVPIYSAVKINGKKLYEYARNGEEITLPKRLVEIKEIEVLKIHIEDNKINVIFKTLVSKGTYIRSLIMDIAKKLNTVATMKELTRTKQGNFIIEDSISLDEIGSEKIIEIGKFNLNYKKEIAEGELLKKITNGALIDNNYEQDILFVDKEQNYIAIYKIYDKDKTMMKPFKMF